MRSVAVAHGLFPRQWNVSRPGIAPMSPALAGRFLTPGLPGKSKESITSSRSDPITGQGQKQDLGQELCIKQHVGIIYSMSGSSLNTFLCNLGL